MIKPPFLQNRINKGFTRHCAKPFIKTVFSILKMFFPKISPEESAVNKSFKESVKLLFQVIESIVKTRDISYLKN